MDNGVSAIVYALTESITMKVNKHQALSCQSSVKLKEAIRRNNSVNTNIMLNVMVSAFTERLQFTV